MQNWLWESQGGCGLKEGGVRHLDPDPQKILVECEKKTKSTKKVIFHTTNIGGRVEIGLPCITSQAGGPLKH